MARLDLTEDQKVKVETAYKDGSSLKDIATVLDCSIPTVSRLLKKRGVFVRSPGRRKKNEAPPKFDVSKRREDILQEAEGEGIDFGV